MKTRFSRIGFCFLTACLALAFAFVLRACPARAERSQPEFDLVEVVKTSTGRSPTVYTNTTYYQRIYLNQSFTEFFSALSAYGFTSSYRITSYTTEWTFVSKHAKVLVSHYPTTGVFFAEAYYQRGYSYEKGAYQPADFTLSAMVEKLGATYCTRNYTNTGGTVTFSQLDKDLGLYNELIAYVEQYKLTKSALSNGFRYTAQDFDLSVTLNKTVATVTLRKVYKPVAVLPAEDFRLKTVCERLGIAIAENKCTKYSETVGCKIEPDLYIQFLDTVRLYGMDENIISDAEMTFSSPYVTLQINGSGSYLEALAIYPRKYSYVSGVLSPAEFWLPDMAKAVEYLNVKYTTSGGDKVATFSETDTDLGLLGQILAYIGQYDMTWVVLDDGRYTFTASGASITVTPADTTITVTAAISAVPAFDPDKPIGSYTVSIVSSSANASLLRVRLNVTAPKNDRGGVPLSAFTLLAEDKTPVARSKPYSACYVLDNGDRVPIAGIVLREEESRTVELEFAFDPAAKFVRSGTKDIGVYACAQCRGSGICSSCHGSGDHWSCGGTGYTYSGSRCVCIEGNCIKCGGYGRCWYCKGKGTIGDTLPEILSGEIVPTPELSTVTSRYAFCVTGESNRWTAAAAGGNGALIYHFRLYRNGIAYKTIGWKSVNTHTFEFTEPGNYTMQVVVQDASGKQSSAVTDGAVTVAALGADMLRLPKGLDAIETDAFRNDKALKAVTAENGLRRIESGAFSNCKALLYVYLPATVTSIADDAFYDSTPAIYCPKGSFAQEWAQLHGMICHAE